AVAIAISIAVAGWLFGLWGSFATGSPQIQVSAAKVDTNGNVQVYIVNSGSGSDKIISAELIVDNTSIPLTLLNNSSSEVPANSAGWYSGSADLSNVNVNAGDTVLIKIYFEKSGVISIPVVVSEGSSGS
ncbi:hypothetical protein apy_12740, partial [Aeropyrum pernix]